MTTSTDANKTTEKNSILTELDDLMKYMDADDNTESEALIDPSFFIGDINGTTNENAPDVPTLTTVANELVTEQKAEQKAERKAEQGEEETAKQPGLFSARVEHFKQEVSVKQATEIQPKQTEQAIPDEFAGMIDDLVAENMPRIEAQLREKITAYLQGKKNS